MNCSRHFATSLLATALLCLAPCAFAQQSPPVEREQQYVGRFVVYGGYMILDSPNISLKETGVHIQAGMRWSRHISAGFDYSRSTGSTTIGLDKATNDLQNL